MLPLHAPHQRSRALKLLSLCTKIRQALMRDTMSVDGVSVVSVATRTLPKLSIPVSRSSCRAGAGPLDGRTHPVQSRSRGRARPQTLHFQVSIQHHTIRVHQLNIASCCHDVALARNCVVHAAHVQDVTVARQSGVAVWQQMSRHADDCCRTAPAHHIRRNHHITAETPRAAAQSQPLRQREDHEVPLGKPWARPWLRPAPRQNLEAARGGRSSTPLSSLIPHPPPWSPRSI